MRHGVTLIKSKQRLECTGNLFRKKTHLKGVC